MIQEPLPQEANSLYADRLHELREAFREQGIDGYLVPMTDAYQNEYIQKADRRIRFLTGFRGTAGFVILLIDKAAFFTDGRYTIQAKEEVPGNLYEVYTTSEKKPDEWLSENIRSRMKIGFDPKLHTADQIKNMEIIVLKHQASLSPCDKNLIDAIWKDRPEPVSTPIHVHDTTYAGKASSQKRTEIGQALQKEGINAALITDPASIAWLFNVRGNDIPYNPLPLSTAILRADGTADWFVDPTKVTPDVERMLGAEITRYTPDDFPAAAIRLGESQSRVLVDPKESSFYYTTILGQSGVSLTLGENPCTLPKACKNMTEIDGMRSAHRRDGAAMVRFLAWLDDQFQRGTVTEIDVVNQLASFRESGSLYRGPSFATIAGSGPNGAIVHYKVTANSNRPLDMNSFLLLDSGGHYLDGTTDITRTIPLGQATTEMRDRYTRVLKGHIALATIRFPEGTQGAELDVLARQYLWQLGLDYAHGTGHGVGCYLPVHEGPQSISRRGTTPLHIGMVLSNEPGFYKARHYGIRLENLMHVIELFEISSPEAKMLGFEPLTLVPFDQRAIEPSLLTHEEKTWLNAYHARVQKAIRPQIDEHTGNWLTQACRPIK
ncbi:MAG: aminopeptidase P family protein [Bdellovibrionales bacterium]